MSNCEVDFIMIEVELFRLEDLVDTDEELCLPGAPMAVRLCLVPWTHPPMPIA